MVIEIVDNVEQQDMTEYSKIMCTFFFLFPNLNIYKTTNRQNFALFLTFYFLRL